METTPLVYDSLFNEAIALVGAPTNRLDQFLLKLISMQDSLDTDTLYDMGNILLLTNKANTFSTNSSVYRCQFIPLLCDRGCGSKSYNIYDRCILTLQRLVNLGLVSEGFLNTVIHDWERNRNAKRQ